jgi:hypothetical protein
MLGGHHTCSGPVEPLFSVDMWSSTYTPGVTGLTRE